MVPKGSKWCEKQQNKTRVKLIIEMDASLSLTGRSQYLAVKFNRQEWKRGKAKVEREEWKIGILRNKGGRKGKGTEKNGEDGEGKLFKRIHLRRFLSLFPPRHCGHPVPLVQYHQSWACSAVCHQYHQSHDRIVNLLESGQSQTPSWHQI